MKHNNIKSFIKNENLISYYPLNEGVGLLIKDLKTNKYKQISHVSANFI